MDPVEVAAPRGQVIPMAADALFMSAQESVLVARCLNGEESACSELFHHYYPELMPICMRYAKDHDEAKDIMQDGFTRIFSNLRSYLGKGAFIGWLKRVMVNAAINHYHASANERSNFHIDDRASNGTLDMRSTEDDVFSRFTMNDLLELVQKLTPAYRTVFNLRVMEGWTHEEIARELRISVSTSKSNLNRARMKLMEQLVRRDPSAARRTERMNHAS